MATLSYASTFGLLNTFSWRNFIRRFGVLACLIFSISACPLCIAWFVNATPLVQIFGRLEWSSVLAIAVPQQLVAFASWIVVAFSLLFDDRALTDAEEAMMPLIPIVLASWALLDMFTAAMCVL